jgi:hypothetical protein
LWWRYRVLVTDGQNDLAVAAGRPSRKGGGACCSPNGHPSDLIEVEIDRGVIERPPRVLTGPAAWTRYEHQQFGDQIVLCVCLLQPIDGSPVGVRSFHRPAASGRYPAGEEFDSDSDIG